MSVQDECRGRKTATRPSSPYLAHTLAQPRWTHASFRPRCAAFAKKASIRPRTSAASWPGAWGRSARRRRRRLLIHGRRAKEWEMVGHDRARAQSVRSRHICTSRFEILGLEDAGEESGRKVGATGAPENQTA